MRLSDGDGDGDGDVAVDVQAEEAVPATATADAVRLVRRLAARTGRRVGYASVVLSVDREWHGRRRNHVEATVDTVGLRLRGFAAAPTFAEALDDLGQVLDRRLDRARDR